MLKIKVVKKILITFAKTRIREDGKDSDQSTSEQRYRLNPDTGESL